jgi:hypothetical protein
MPIGWGRRGLRLRAEAPYRIIEPTHPSEDPCRDGNHEPRLHGADEGHDAGAV